MQTLPFTNVGGTQGKSKLAEKRTDSGQVRNRLIKKFNSISPKMQDAIAQGLSLKPTFVDPNKLENRDIKTIDNMNQSNRDKQNAGLAKPLRGLKSGLAVQIQSVVNNNNSKMPSQKAKLSRSRDSQSGERQGERREFKMTKFKITPGANKMSQKSMTNILHKPLQKPEYRQAKHFQQIQIPKTGSIQMM